MIDHHVCEDGLTRETRGGPCRVCGWAPPEAPSAPARPSPEELRRGTKRDLAAKFGVSPALISTWRKKAGVVGDPSPGEVRELRQRVVELEAEVERLSTQLREARGLTPTRPLAGTPMDRLLAEVERLGARGLARALGINQSEVSRVASGVTAARPARIARWLAVAEATPTPLRASARRGKLRTPRPRVGE